MDPALCFLPRGFVAFSVVMEKWLTRRSGESLLGKRRCQMLSGSTLATFIIIRQKEKKKALVDLSGIPQISPVFTVLLSYVSTGFVGLNFHEPFKT